MTVSENDVYSGNSAYRNCKNYIRYSREINFHIDINYFYFECILPLLEIELEKLHFLVYVNLHNGLTLFFMATEHRFRC